MDDGPPNVYSKNFRMYLKTTLAIFAVACLGAFFNNALTSAQDEMAVLFDTALEQPGAYVGIMENGSKVLLKVQTLRPNRTGGADVTGVMILGGQSQPVRGTLFIAANATIFYPVASTHLNAVSGFTKSGGPDYELSGSKRGIWKNKTVGGIITSFDHGTNGPYVLSEKEDWTICYVNQNGFDKFTF
jgi:hypothetical protein|tara:strand:- start:101 stop:661 length:561 start_codon:yes stop_codon:yes gene_type:complete